MAEPATLCEGGEAPPGPGAIPLAAPDAGVAPTAASRPGLLADLAALTKPRITFMVVATMLGGSALAGRFGRAHGAAETPFATVALGLAGTVLVVAGANTLNMYIERDTDRLMRRTRDRPLPARRMAPEVALWFGIALSAVALPLLFALVNVTTGALAAFALASYVLAYTPLKRRTTWSLLIGAVPGAIPPLLGWTTVAGRVQLPGLLLFGILFFWQIPHFLAIATFRRDDYERAGLQVLPVTRGDRVTRRHIVGYLLVLLAVTGLLVPAGVGGPFYLGAAAVLGAGFLGTGLWGLRPSAGARWARGLFFVSILYLVLLLAALMVGS